jgi:hypothetical protein
MPARIQNSEALLETKAAIIKFIDAVNASLASIDSEVMRMTMWLNQDRVPHWRSEIRRREDKVNQCKAAIAAKQLARMPEPADTTMERRAQRRAEERVESARQRLEATKRWAPVWEREASKYKMGCAKLSDATHRELPIAIGRLENMLRVLEEYERLQGPMSDVGHQVRYEIEQLPSPPALDSEAGR